jgi:hypothetical protein
MSSLRALALAKAHSLASYLYACNDGRLWRKLVLEDARISFLPDAPTDKGEEVFCSFSVPWLRLRHDLMPNC